MQSTDASTVATIIGLSFVGKDVVTDFLKRVLGPVGDATGKALAHPIEEWHRKRVERAAALIAEAAEMLRAADVQASPFPGRILWPILERGSIEEEDALRTRWASLLANAADVRGRTQVNPAFLRVLSELTPAEVSLLDSHWQYVEAARQRGDGYYHIGFFIPQESGGIEEAVTLKHFVSIGLIEEEREYRIDVNDVGEQLTRAIQHRPSFGITKVETHVSRYFMGLFGIRFLEACRPPEC